jgi:hypothetical protein
MGPENITHDHMEQTENAIEQDLITYFCQYGDKFYRPIRAGT